MEDEMIQLMLIGLMEDAEQIDRRKYRQRGDPFNDLSDKQFITMFRLSKELSRYLIDIISEYITPANRAQDLDIPTKVLVTLRFLASGSYQMDIGCNFNFSVSQSSVSRCVSEVVEVLNRNEIFQRFVKFPANIDQLNQLRLEFNRRYNFPGTIGCIDCTHVAIYPPKVHDEAHPENLYINRKHYHSINVQLICDYNLKIMNVNALFPGSTNDAFIWNNSNVHTILRRLHETGNTNYYLLGDSGYPLRTWLMTPLENEPQEGTLEYLYNKKHKTIRSLIERCNGVLKMRFRCLLKHRVLHYAPEKASKIVNACVVLHNLCIEHNVPEPDDDVIAQADFGIYVPLINNVDNEENFRRINPELAAGRQLRSIIIQNLQVQ